MAEDDPNAKGVYVEVNGEEEQEKESSKLNQRKGRGTRETFPVVLNRLASATLFPEPGTSGSLLNRIKISVLDNAPLLPEASRNSFCDVLRWTRRGSPLRTLLVVSVSSVFPQKEIQFLK